MQAFAQYAQHELEWRQPSAMEMRYELRAGEQLAGSLRFRSMWGSLATGESAGGCWTFKRVGFWQTRATVRVCDTDADIATFANNTWSGGGTLSLPDGRTFTASTNAWETKLELRDSQNLLLISYANRGVLRLAASVTIEPYAVAWPELPWLTVFGWYLVVMMYMDASAASAAT